MTNIIGRVPTVALRSYERRPRTIIGHNHPISTAVPALPARCPIASRSGLGPATPQVVLNHVILVNEGSSFTSLGSRQSHVHKKDQRRGVYI